MPDDSGGVYIAFGSSIDPEQNIPDALDLLNARCAVLAVSRMYRSRALDRPGDPDFVNGVCEVRTALPPRALKYDILREIERRLGRVRTKDAYAPRTIDLDIALYRDAVIEEPGLAVPDPDIASRPFLAVPLLELAPDLVLPGTGVRLADAVRGMDAGELAPAENVAGALRKRSTNESGSYRGAY